MADYVIESLSLKALVGQTWNIDSAEAYNIVGGQWTILVIYGGTSMFIVVIILKVKSSKKVCPVPMELNTLYLEFEIIYK